MRPRAAAVVVLLFAIAGICPAAEKTAHQRYAALNALRPDSSAVYTVQAGDRIELHRSDVKLAFEEGKLAFFAPCEGRVTGAVFSGRGHALALPRDVVEKQQMARFLGAPLLDQEFTTAYLRFTDGAAEDLLRQLRTAKREPVGDPAFTAEWDSPVGRLNPPHSLRLLFDSMRTDSRPYFYAALEGAVTGPFDFLLDMDRAEALLLGQVRKNTGQPYYDVWASYEPPGLAPPRPDFRALHYSIDATLLPSNSLQGTTALRILPEAGLARVLILQLARSLSVQHASDEAGYELETFQNEGLTSRERTARGNDFLYVVLPQAPVKGREFTIKISYQGNVIENAGNGVLYVGAHESWYPRLGDSSEFADYDLAIRWPRRLQLVATGVKLDQRDDGDFRLGHWRTEKPASVVGFNVGDYASVSVPESRYSVDVYANRQLEQALTNRLSAEDERLPLPLSPLPLPGTLGAQRFPSAPAPVPSPAETLKQLGRDIDSSIRFYEAFNGPFPFKSLNVSQIPGTTAQGWPGLLYLSTFSYLPPEAQRRAGLATSTQEHFTQLVPFHEVAHQWWGNVVGWSSYRDQWIDEAMANYLALLFADSQKNPEQTLRVWLARFRDRLLTKGIDSDEAPADAGALTLGTRLISSRSPDGYQPLIYDKGAWVIHMIREMLREPRAKHPDDRFIQLLQTILRKYAFQSFSTADLQKEVEAVMTKSMDLEGGRSMDWFFDQWINGTGIPRYRVEFSARPSEKGVVVHGKLFQSGVPRSFIAPVPIYANLVTGRTVFLGTVVTNGNETPFRLPAPAAPRKLLIDPQLTLLCAAE